MAYWTPEDTGRFVMIRVDRVTSKDIEKILNLYREICGGVTRYVDPEDICSKLRAGDPIPEYRAGSRWDPHSKLYFHSEDGHVWASMDENFHPDDRRRDNLDYVSALAAAERFKDAVQAL